MSTSQNLGKVCVTPKGSWASGTAYEKLDIVGNQGNSYIALKSVPAGTLLTNTEYWQLIAQKGEMGNVGRYLSTWDSTTGLPQTNPISVPYYYYTGDYYIVMKTGATNYKPNGDAYDGTASTTVDTNTVEVGDMYKYDGTVWELLKFSSVLSIYQKKPTIKTTMDATAVVGTQYYLGSQSSVSFTLPSSASMGDEIVVVFYSGSTAATLTVSGSYIGTAPTPSTNQRIELNFLYDGTNWTLLSNAQAVAV